ncbi:MAG: phosphopantetheine-binding protein, partial [Pseudonocardiaceae bacterium]
MNDGPAADPVRAEHNGVATGGAAAGGAAAGGAATGGAAACGAPGEALIAEFLRTGRDMIAAQRDVLLSYLGGAPTAQSAPSGTAPTTPTLQVPTLQAPAQTEWQAPAQPQRPVEIVPVRGPGPAHSTSEPDISSGAGAGSPRLTTAEITETVVDVIAERTGYPADMISPDLDLEADLSIDSIKRAEIAGNLAVRLGLAGAGGAATAGLGDAELEELSKARTVAAISTWLAGKLGADSAEPAAEVPVPGQPVAPELPAPAALAAPAAPAALAGSAAPARMVLREVELSETARPEAELAGQRFVLLAAASVGEQVLTEHLLSALTELGADVTVHDPRHEFGPADRDVHGVIHLGALSASDIPLLPGSFPPLKAVLAAAPRRLILASPGTAADDRADGLRGFVRAAAREYPEMVARVVEVDPTLPAQALAAVLVNEVLTDSGHPVVRGTAGGRRGLELVAEPLAGAGDSTAGGAGDNTGDGAAAAAAMGLDGASVVLLVGGGRGIAARFAVELAQASHCRIELIGRTPSPVEPVTSDYGMATDAAAVRAELAARQGGSPAEIEREVSFVMAQRELGATLAELGESASSVRYQCADVRDADAVHRMIKEVHAEHGRLDGVVYAA